MFRKVLGVLTVHVILALLMPLSPVFSGLAVDYFNERLYWADAKLSAIGSVLLNGSDPVVIINSSSVLFINYTKLVQFIDLQLRKRDQNCSS